MNHHSWGCRHYHVLHALVQAAHLSAAVVLSMSCGLQVSDTHRLDDNKAERKRCEDAGFEVCKSTVDGKPVGPERVWPGGLAMSRTIGDHMVSPATMHSSCMYFLSPLAALLCMHKQPSCPTEHVACSKAVYACTAEQPVGLRNTCRMNVGQHTRLGTQYSCSTSHVFISRLWSRDSCMYSCCVSCTLVFMLRQSALLACRPLGRQQQRLGQTHLQG